MYKLHFSAILKGFMIATTSLSIFQGILKTISLQRIFFILFLFTLPFSLRKVLVIFSPNGVFNEYMEVSVYLSDILLALTLLFFILENKSFILSIEYWKKMFHVEQLLLPIFIPSFFILWSGLSIFWSESSLLALSAFLRLLEGYFLYFYILISIVPRGTIVKDRMNCSTWNNCDNNTTKTIDQKMFHVEHFNHNTKNVPRGTFFSSILSTVSKCSTWNIWQVVFTIIVLSALFQSFIAIFQFLFQKSLGLGFLGESIFSVFDSGIAKIMINSDILVRSYGLFAHPNILGGFLAISLLITLIYPVLFNIKMFHVEQFNHNTRNVPRGTFLSKVLNIIKKCSTWNNISKISKLFHVEHYKIFWIYRVIIFIQLLALFFSFSKSAIISYILGFILIVYQISKMFHVEHLSQTGFRDGSQSVEKVMSTKNVPRGTFLSTFFGYWKKCSTWNILNQYAVKVFKKMFHVEHFLIISGIILLVIILFSFNIRLFLIQPSFERFFYIQSIKPLYEGYWLAGLGMGQYVFMMQQFFDEKLMLWQLQPIHNVFLLIFSELGIVGLILFLWFFGYVYLKTNNVPRGTLLLKYPKCSTWNIITQIPKMFHVEHLSQSGFRDGSQSTEKVMSTKNVPRGTFLRYLLRSLLIVIAFIMLFDHYFWDIQPAQLLLWIILALAVSSQRY